jgi:pimeloyl-ACP methyl ester carboxylesterase
MIFHHGVLGSSLEVGQLTDAAAKRLGLRIIAPERPGFGSSDPKPGRSILAWADDLLQLLDALELEQADLGGYAMGGLFACAAAFCLPQRIRKMLLISFGVAASTREEFAGTVPLFRLNNRLARDMPSVHRAFISILRRGIISNPDRFFRQLVTNMSREEARHVESALFRERFFEAMVEGARQGSAHFAREIELLMADWGFDPAQITVAAELWHGNLDRHVPMVLGQKLAASMPNAAFVPMPGHGHFMVYDCMEEILSRYLQAGALQDAGEESVSSLPQ